MSRLYRVARIIDLAVTVMVNELKIISREPGGLAILIIMPYIVAGGIAFVASFFTRVTRYEFLGEFIGFEVLTMSMLMVQTGARFIREERDGGRLESLMATPTSMYLILFSTSLSLMIVNMGAFIVAALPIIYLTYGPASILNLTLSLILLFIGLLPLYGIGLFFAGIVVRFRDVDALMNVLTSLLSVLSGATYPIYILPTWLRAVVYALPIYQLYESIMGIITRGGIPPIVYTLLASAIVYVLVGLTSYGAFERSMLRRGIA